MRSVTAWSHIFTGCTGFAAFKSGAATRGSRDAAVEALLNFRRVSLLRLLLLLLLRLCRRRNTEHSHYCE